MDVFTSEILESYYKHQKYSSFQRQLNLYGFRKIAKGPDTGAYAHPAFSRDEPGNLWHVRRIPPGTAAGFCPSPPLPTAAFSAKSSASRLAVRSTGRNKLVFSSSKRREAEESTGGGYLTRRLSGCLARRRYHESSDEEDLEGSGDEDVSTCTEDESEDTGGMPLVATARPVNDPYLVVGAPPATRPGFRPEVSEESCESNDGVEAAYAEGLWNEDDFDDEIRNFDVVEQQPVCEDTQKLARTVDEKLSLAPLALATVAPLAEVTEAMPRGLGVDMEPLSPLVSFEWTGINLVRSKSTQESTQQLERLQSGQAPTPGSTAASFFGQPGALGRVESSWSGFLSPGTMLPPTPRTKSALSMDSAFAAPPPPPLTQRLTSANWGAVDGISDLPPNIERIFSQSMAPPLTIEMDR